MRVGQSDMMLVLLPLLLLLPCCPFSFPEPVPALVSPLLIAPLLLPCCSITVDYCSPVAPLLLPRCGISALVLRYGIGSIAPLLLFEGNTTTLQPCIYLTSSTINLLYVCNMCYELFTCWYLLCCGL